MARPRRQPIPITVVSGPLGAGKTTLINRALMVPAFANTAVILNEFGDVPLENALIERAEDGIIALGAGCICCAVRGELVDALERLLRDLDNGRVEALARVVIEADASADSSAIFAGIGMHPYLSLRFRADGIVAVVPASEIAAFAVRPTALRQLAMADAIAISGPGPIADAAVRALARVNPIAAIVDASTVDPVALTGFGADPAAVDFGRWLGPLVESNETGPVHVFTVVCERPIPLAALDRFLEYLVALLGSNLIRVRGLIAVGNGESAMVEGIGAFFRPMVLVTTPPDAPAVRFSIAAATLDRIGFESYLDAFLNEARIDTPDRAAITDNPLHVAGFSARRGR